MLRAPMFDDRASLMSKYRAWLPLGGALHQAAGTSSAMAQLGTLAGTGRNIRLIGARVSDQRYCARSILSDKDSHFAWRDVGVENSASVELCDD